MQNSFLNKTLCEKTYSGKVKRGGRPLSWIIVAGNHRAMWGTCTETLHL